MTTLADIISRDPRIIEKPDLACVHCELPTCNEADAGCWFTQLKAMKALAQPAPEPAEPPEPQEMLDAAKERRRANNRAYYARHRERLKLAAKAYRDANPEKMKEKHARFVQQRREKKQAARMNDNL